MSNPIQQSPNSPINTGANTALGAKAKVELVIRPARLSWQSDHSGAVVPVSDEFCDVYFSKYNGLAETQHVFLAGNDLVERFANLSDFNTFTIAELGFGTGLNVLAAWQCWQQHVKQKPNQTQARLHIISTELHPLSKADLKRALGVFTELGEFSKQLIAQYPPLIEGCHRLKLAEDVTLDLWLGDAAVSLRKIPLTTAVDAWFLDGFAPKCNAKLWSDTVLDEVLRLSHTGTTAATFSVAGVIKRGLIKRGFTIEKRAGFGKKREMLTATLCQKSRKSAQAKTAPTPSKTKKLIAVVGAGVAGLCTAYAFASRGHEVVVFDAEQPLSGASGNPRAILAPKLTPIHHVSEHLHSISYMYATRFYKGMNHGLQGIFEQTSILDLLNQSNVSPEQINQYPRDFAQIFDPERAINLAKVTLPQSMYLPAAGLINPLTLAKHILSHERITFTQAKVVQILQEEINHAHLNHSTKNVTLYDASSVMTKVDMVVICTAQDCHLLQNTLPKPRITRGQVSWFKPKRLKGINDTPLPKTPLKYGGYCVPFTQDGEKHFLLGATFVRGTDDLTISAQEHQQNCDKFLAALPQYQGLKVSEHWQGRASLRAQMPDYLPLVGQVNADIFTLSAMGSKGFSYAPLCAEIIAGMALDEALPVPQTLLAKLDPLRFATRS